ncbi:MAG: MATE family efflux transporter [Oscillospiraceae bacterium]|nr:MATE family efflux transporter [Oscillospiraceae bacterium]
MRKYDLTEGNILRRILLVAAPLMATQFLTMTYNLTDMFWLGRVGSDAVASAGSAGIFMWLSMSFIVTGRMGAEIGVSQSIGRQDPVAAKTYAQTAIFLSIVLSLFFAATIFLFRSSLIGFFNIREAHVEADAITYLGIVMFGMPASFFSAAVTGTFNGSGNSRLPFLTNGFGLVFNIVLTPIMIFTLDLGIVGAAWSTVIAQNTVLVLNLLAIRFLRLRPFDDLRIFALPKGVIVRQIFRWTLPVSAEASGFTLVAIIIGRFVAAFGADAIAIQRVGIQVESFSWMISGGFASGVTAFVGQNYGRGLWSRIRRCNTIALWAMVFWGIVTTLIPWVFGPQLFALFIPDEAILANGIRFLRIFSLGQLFICLEFWTIGIFRGMGKTAPPSIATLTGNIIRVPLAYFMSTTALGLAGLWWGLVLGTVIRAAILIVWFLLFTNKLPREDEDRSQTQAIPQPKGGTS